MPGGDRRGQQRKVFFLEKKKQKTFATLAPSVQQRQANVKKFFGSFFSKKNAFF
jgi:hypothetical protein